jgi:hypothetical protein
MDVVYKTLTVQYKKLATQVQILANEFYCTLEVQKLVVSMPMRLAKVSQKEGWTTHYKYMY